MWPPGTRPFRPLSERHKTDKFNSAPPHGRSHGLNYANHVLLLYSKMFDCPISSELLLKVRHLFNEKFNEFLFSFLKEIFISGNESRVEGTSRMNLVLLIARDDMRNSRTRKTMSRSRLCAAQFSSSGIFLEKIFKGSNGSTRFFKFKI